MRFLRSTLRFESAVTSDASCIANRMYSSSVFAIRCFNPAIQSHVIYKLRNGKGM
ncbi:hypothetical protein Hanom_Chr05g00390681 [Helianthus anomalus]